MRPAALSLLRAAILVAYLAPSVHAQFGPYVTINNLTHPDLSPNFIAGDTYQNVIYGLPNQPVYISQNGSSPQLVGQTDGSGNYITSGVEQQAWIGNYTQVWTVGSTAAAPVSFTLSAACSSSQSHSPQSRSQLHRWRHIPL